MAQELGKIERPSAASFEGSRKLFFVPLVYSPAEPPADYVGMLERYWMGARNQLRRLTERTGPLAHVYHEGVTAEGEAGKVLIEQINPRSQTLLDEFIQAGAKIEAFEDLETFSEMIDWQRCLMSGLTSRKVMETAMTGYRDALKRRTDLMIQNIEQTLQPGESGVLLLPENHGLQFPREIQVFYIAPPALDEIHRWERDQSEKARQAQAGQASGETAEAGPERTES
ncbi:MAG TPA: hypothetical protein VFZ25_07450 [Chloroflexota bacterium]|nr:hypothetical protein [Chloroflexota bacterium]